MIHKDEKDDETALTCHCRNDNYFTQYKPTSDEKGSQLQCGFCHKYYLKEKDWGQQAFYCDTTYRPKSGLFISGYLCGYDTLVHQPLVNLDLIAQECGTKSKVSDDICDFCVCKAHKKNYLRIVGQDCWGNSLGNIAQQLKESSK